MALRPTSPQNQNDKLAARDNAQADAFLREVDDALREDQMFGALRRWGKPAAGVVALSLAALGGGLWWKSHQRSLDEERTITLTKAIDQIDAQRLDLASGTLDGLAKSDARGSAALAKLLQAGLAAQQKKPAEAAKLYDAVANDASAPKPFRDLALVRGTAAAFDTLKPEEVITRLKPLAVPGNPWFGVAGELVAMADLKSGKTAEAGTLLREIAKSKDVPDSLKGRARQMAGLLGYDSLDDVAPVAAGGAAGAAAPAAGAPAPAGAPAAAPAPAGQP